MATEAQTTSSERLTLRKLALQRIEEARVAGRNTRHNRLANLAAVQSVIEGDSHYTWDIRGVDAFGYNEVLGAIAAITGCPSDPSVREGGGYISPSAALRGLEEAATRVALASRRGGRFLLGTGHPGSLLYYYVELARLIRDWGGQVLEPARGAQVPPNLNLDFVGGVAVTTDRASLMHSHDHRAMDAMIAEAGPVDLIVADHGYAAAAVNAGIPLVAMMDTNDPALALARELGADVTIMPMDDNRPLSDYLPVIDLLRSFGNLAIAEEATQSKPAEPAGASQLATRLQAAERFVHACLDDGRDIDRLVAGVISGYRDQFVQVHCAQDDNDAISDPLVDLVLYKELHGALERVVLQRLRPKLTQLDPEWVHSYLHAAGPQSSRQGTSDDDDSGD
jgi:hypothetical protein